LFQVRDDVLGKLEAMRTSKLIGSSLEARVVVHAHGKRYQLLKRYSEQLRYIFIVSQVELVDRGNILEDPQSEPLNDLFVVEVHRAAGEKCERCWNYSTRVGESTRYPTACERCVEALAEIEREEAA
jgi:isoleucyl-tRNA synthetase